MNNGVIKNPDDVFLLESNTVVCDNKSVSRLILGQEYGDCMTLSDLRSMFSDANELLVVSEFPLQGVVCRFGNHGDIWEKVGDTCGYA